MRILITLLLLGIFATGSAQDEPAAEPEPEPPEFDVEIIVVRNLSPDDIERRLPSLEQPPEADGEPAAEAPRPKLRRFPALRTGELRLGAVNERLLRSEGWSPILHFGWRQPAESREEAGAMSVAGNRLGAAVTGTVRLSLDRFLRLEVDLELDPATGELYAMDQGRRLRSGQVHYFDHPQFGVIAVVNRAPEPTP